jgi:hypothetical protein
MAATTKLTGILTDVFPIETFQSGFAKRVFWLKEPDTERYPQHWQIELQQSDVSQIDQYKTGDTLEVEVEIRGKKWEIYGGKQGIVTSLKCVGILLKERLPAMTSKPRR